MENTTVVETPVEVQDVDTSEMSDEQFDSHMESEFDTMKVMEESKEREYEEGMQTAIDAQGDPDEFVDGSNDPIHLDDLYSAQIASEDSKLEKPILIKVNGAVIEVDNINDLKNMAEKSVGSTQKFQAIAQHKKTLQFMEDNNISEQDLNQLITDRGLQPVQSDNEGGSQNMEQVETIANEILNSDYAEAFQDGLKIVPEDIRETMSSNPQLLSDLAGDYQSGLAQKIMPTVNKYMNVNGLSFFEAYAKAGQELSEPTDVQDANNKRVQTLRAEPKSNTRSAPRNQSVKVSDLSDDDFDKYFEAM